jgi:crotonobetainyl-CoA:carnitine CoA-transferase CaiB-like acyl-CoA transferase
MEAKPVPSLPGALDGVRILDVTEPLGAFVSRILGDLGADVIKVEPPGGDPGRDFYPFITKDAERLSLSFVRANVNKRSIILDLEQREDQEQFRALVEQSDVAEHRRYGHMGSAGY